MSPQASELVFWVHAAATWYMAGVIVIIQFVHYPLMRHVPSAGFALFERQHTGRMGYVVAPAMLIESIGAVLLAVWPPAASMRLALWLGLAIVAALWLCTWLLSVPCHRRLSQGWDAATHRRLVATNWPRTVLWLTRGVLLLWLASRFPA